ncbi:hypothetical protein D5F01_LYC23663 [Larimichthys crocea]|uniref:Uncharacterized protein n=1 Tax=Larimichthys crocea TaxID=215358 RepID=A0A6G0HHR9_LARCR|nr:hypothetical protein D5F01_LYC23663 [Larimichthys crocea]
MEKYSAEREKNSELEEALKQKDLQLKSVPEKLEEVKQPSLSPGEDAEEQPPVSDETDVDRSTSVSPIPEEKAEEQPSVSDDVETFSEDTDTDDRRLLLPEPDFDQHLTVQRIRKRGNGMVMGRKMPRLATPGSPSGHRLATDRQDQAQKISL